MRTQRLQGLTLRLVVTGERHHMDALLTRQSQHAAHHLAHDSSVIVQRLQVDKLEPSQIALIATHRHRVAGELPVALESRNQRRLALEREAPRQRGRLADGLQAILPLAKPRPEPIEARVGVG